MPIMARGRRGTLEPSVADVIEATQAGTTAKGTMRGSIQSDLVLVILKFQIGHTIPAGDIGGPPENVQMEVVVQGNNRLLAETSPKSFQHPRELEPTRSDDFTDLKELPE
jgi:hypothetical protein